MILVNVGEHLTKQEMLLWKSLWWPVWRFEDRESQMKHAGVGNERYKFFHGLHG
jgi:hypothetical protein